MIDIDWDRLIQAAYFGIDHIFFKEVDEKFLLIGIQYPVFQNAGISIFGKFFKTVFLSGGRG